jgi:hypothetical protein
LRLSCNVVWRNATLYSMGFHIGMLLQLFLTHAMMIIMIPSEKCSVYCQAHTVPVCVFVYVFHFHMPLILFSSSTSCRFSVPHFVDFPSPVTSLFVLLSTRDGEFSCFY